MELADQRIGLTTGKRKTEHWWDDERGRKVVILGILVFIFFLVELITGLAVGSLALVSDAFHMLSDGLSLVIGYLAIRIRKKEKTDSLPYGYDRAEVLGGLVNGSFLVSVCLFVFMEAIQRFFEPITVSDGPLILIVGGLGMAVNLIGIWMFSGHAHAHAGHSHSHSHSHGRSLSDDHDHDHDHDHSHSHSHSHGSSEGHENMHGIFLHVLGDLLGSVGVMISGSVIAFTDWEGRFLLDPIISLFITALILFSTIPLIKRCSMILLQSVPDYLDIQHVRDELSAIDNVLDIHDLHVWQLADQKIICSVHVRCPEHASFTRMAFAMKTILHSHGIHSSTIQPEFVTDDMTQDEAVAACNMLCAKDCENLDESCCPPPAEPVPAAPTAPTSSTGSINADRDRV